MRHAWNRGLALTAAVLLATMAAYAQGGGRLSAGRLRVRSAQPGRDIRPALAARAADASDTGRVDELGPEKALEFLHIEAVDSEISQTFDSARPGEYPFETPAKVRIAATSGGWRLYLRVTRLGSSDTVDEIPPEEVCWRDDEGDLFPLDVLTLVLDEGLPGESLIETDLALRTDTFHAAGRYTGVLFVTAKHPCAKTVYAEIRIRVEIRQQFSHTVENNKIYFHFADLAAMQTAMVSGLISADGPMALVLEAAEGGVGELPLQKTLGSPGHPFDDPIPIEWKLTESGSSGPREPDQYSSGGQRASWELNNVPGDTTYALECMIAPTAYQAPGSYGKAWMLTIAPRM